MKKVISFFGIIAILAIISLSMFACDSDSSGNVAGGVNASSLNGKWKHDDSNSYFDFKNGNWEHGNFPSYTPREGGTYTINGNKLAIKTTRFFISEKGKWYSRSDIENEYPGYYSSADLDKLFVSITYTFRIEGNTLTLYHPSLGSGDGSQGGGNSGLSGYETYTKI